MSNGTIQQRSKVDQSISMIEFSSYAFDLSSFTSTGAVPTLKPMERPTAYLLNPDPDDPYFREFPGKFRAELHDRLTAPLYCFLFALVPLLFLGQAQSDPPEPHGQRSPRRCLLTVSSAPFRSSSPAETSLIAAIAMYACRSGSPGSSICAHPCRRSAPSAGSARRASANGCYARASGLVDARAAAAAQ